jgi:hypothetical protein
MTKLDEICDYINNLPAERQKILTSDFLDILYKHRVDKFRNETTLEFENGYGISFWYSESPILREGSYSFVIYPLCNEEEIILEEKDLYQVKCWLKAWDVMNLPEYVDPKSGEKIIAQIRSKCNNLDDLAKIKTAIECMMDELA